MDLRDDDHVEDADVPVTDGGQARFTAVETKSGEENFNIICNLKCKLHRFDEGENQWKERGHGQAKIMQAKDKPDRYVFILRREGTGKLAAQHELLPRITLATPSGGGEKQLVWSTPADFSDDDEGIPETFLIRFVSKEMADEFRVAFAAATRK